MNKKKLIAITVTGLLILALGASIVGAAPYESPSSSNVSWQGHGYMNLTADQQKEMQPLLDKMIDLRKQMVQKKVDFKMISQEDADRRIAWMEERHNNRGGHRGSGSQGMGDGMGGGFMHGTAALNTEQKQEIRPLMDQMIDIRKQMIQQMVKNGSMTQSAADQRISWMEDRSNAWLENDSSKYGMGHGYGSGNGHGNGRGNGGGHRGW